MAWPTKMDLLGHRPDLVRKARSYDRHFRALTHPARHPEEGLPHDGIYCRKDRLGGRCPEIEW